MYTIFRSFLSQYSRRLLSILAQVKKQNNKGNNSWLTTAVTFLCCERFIMIPQLHKSAKHKKKCGAHTHAHHLSRLSFSIFTSVVVYSRTKKTKKKHNKISWVRRADITLLCYAIYTSRYLSVCLSNLIK